MKHVFKMLSVMMLAVSVSSCVIVVDTITPIAATQTSQVGTDTNVVKVYYNVAGSFGANYYVNSSGISLVTLDSVVLAGSSTNNTRAVVVVNNTVAPCTALVAGQGCFQITIANTQGKSGVSGQISFKLDGAPLRLNYSATFLNASQTPSSAVVVTTEGVSDVKFKVYFTAKTASNQPYNVNQAGLTEITLVNVNQTNASGTATRAVIVVPVTSAVSCAALNAGQGCFEFTLGSRTTKASIFIEGTVNFKLDGTPLKLPFSHTFPAIP